MSTNLGSSGCPYKNAGNPALLSMLSPGARRVLDVGCGAGDNARLLRRDREGIEVYGVTLSPAEAQVAGKHMRHCWVADVERDPLDFLAGETFDCLLMSHVLEHLANPVRVLQRLTSFLEPGGEVLIAVPNVLQWSARLRLVTGQFDYVQDGVFDQTHLRFYTVASAPRELVGPLPELELVRQTATGAVPLWLLRRHVLPQSWSHRIDRWGVRHWPGLFAGQILLLAAKRSSNCTSWAQGDSRTTPPGQAAGGASA